MSAGGDEVEAAMDAIVWSSRPFHARFRVEILLIFAFDEIGDWLPAEKKFQKISRMRLTGSDGWIGKVRMTSMMFSLNFLSSPVAVIDRISEPWSVDYGK